MIATMDERRAAFSTLREGSLHAALKAHYAGPDGRCEVTIDGFVVDVERDGAIVEIQTTSLGSIRRKLERLVERHRVVLVHPLAIERWLVRVDADGAVLRRRRSPKRGLAVDAFEELLAVRSLVGNPNFRLEIPLVHVEEVRGPVPPAARYRYPRQWWRLDRRLLEIVEIRHVAQAADLAGLLPDGLPSPFTSADIVAATRRSRRLAMRAAYCLEQTGAARRCGRRGRFLTYQLVASRAG